MNERMENSSAIRITTLNNFSDIELNNFTEEKPTLSSYYPLLAVELGLSIICSVLLIIVYVFIGEHKTLPGKNVISISCCLIITYILLTLDLLLRNSFSSVLCEIIGVTVQATFLATFFWTNVMSYDIMKTLASVNPDSVRDTNYWKYSVYAWTMTLICVIPTIVLDHSEIVPKEFRPNYGVQKCWLSGQVAYLLYFNTPVGMTLAANCVFFLMTARTIMKVRNATTILAANRHKKRYRLCIKLVLIMGLIWITEFIPWLTGIYYLYAVAGMLNCLHGVYLFFIFACKKRTFKQVSGICFSNIKATDAIKKQLQIPTTIVVILKEKDTF